MKNKNLLSVSRGVYFLLMISFQVLMTSHSSASEPPVLDFGGEFTLTNHHGASTQLSDFKGKVVVMSFGFTNCPDVCPVTLNQLNYLLNELGDNSSKVQNLFISIDPERDTADKLKNYLAYFDPSFIGLTGEVDDIKSVARKYHSSFKKHPLSLKGDYVYGHTVSVFLIDQAGQLRGHYKIESEYKALLKDVKTLVSSNNGKKSLNSQQPANVSSKIKIEDAWVRGLPPTMNKTAAYLTVSNEGNTADQLIAISSPLASSMEMHDSFKKDGMVVMQQVQNITIPANGSVKLEPRGLHAMLLDVTHIPTLGSQVPLTLTFKRSGNVSVLATVKKAATMNHAHHH